MTLAAFKIAKRLVSFNGGSFEVKGLSLDDISVLVGSHLQDVNRLFKMYEKPELRETAVAESVKIAVGIVKDAPALVGTMIATCAGEPGMIEIARQLPIDVQITALREIIELTFEDSGGAKKFVDTMKGLVARVRPLTKAEV